MSCATHLACFACAKRYPIDRLINLCACGKPLRVEYDLARAARELDRDDPARYRSLGMWRFRDLLPVPRDTQPVSLGEGNTPMPAAPELARQIGVSRLWIKDESVNPTGSFKARGMSAAVTMAKHLGAGKLATPSAGNAGGALAAYAAAAGLAAHVFMPRDVPAANRLECELFGARVTLVDGLIDDCARLLAERKAAEGWFDVSTLKEPYRIEGKKTLGYEIAADLGWRLPSVIVYPTGGGTGLVGMAKAFEEMRTLGWVTDPMPRFVSVQAAGCAPIVRAFEAGLPEAARWEGAETVAAGLRVPAAIADFIMLKVLVDSHGTAVAVSDEDMVQAARVLSAATGICACPEGGACLAALRGLRWRGWITQDDRVVIFNTASGLKYSEAWQAERRAPRGANQ
ncbi:MAG: threonine synthase [Phycisphaerales bacterium]|nr:MAG: threonine synthase [Phycisphaerales bacterium]